MVLPQKPPLGKNKYITEIVQATPNEYGVALPLEEQRQFPDDTTRIVLAWTVNADEWLQVFSTLMYGLDNAYPNRAIDTMQIFLRMVTHMSEFCDEVANCINNDQAVRDAITNYLIESGSTNPNEIDPDNTSVDERMSQAQQQSEISAPPPGCDKDTLWSGVKEIVVRLDDNGRTILEQAAVINDVYERYSNLIDAIPIIGDLAADVANNLTEVIPDMLNSYNAYSSITNIETLACELFEIVCNECRYPTFEEVADTIASHAFGGLLSWETMSLATVASQFISTGQYTPTLVWHSMLLFELFTLYLDARFGGANGSRALTQWALLGEDVPSDEWTLLCSGCQTVQCVRWDFTIDEQGWTPFFSAGNCQTVYISGVGFEGSGNEADRTIIYRTLPEQVTIDEVRVNYDQTAFPSVNWFVYDSPAFPQENDPGTQYRISPSQVIDNGGGNRTAIFTGVGARTEIMSHLQIGGSSATPTFTIKWMEMDYQRATPLSLDGSPC